MEGIPSSSSVPSPRGSSIFSQLTKSPRKPPPVFNPAFTSAAGVIKDLNATSRARNNFIRTFKAGVHKIQFFVKRRAPDGSKLDRGPEYTPRGTYVGDWESNTAGQSSRGWSSRRCGVGAQTYPDGSRYEGMWYNDMQQGEGKFYVIRGGGDTSKKKGTPGKGTLALEYSGSWYMGKKHGSGKQTYANGDVCVPFLYFF